jgi:hypothetical protein
MEEPKRESHQITGNEQSLIIRAALAELSPSIYEIQPNPNDSATLGQLIEDVIWDSIKALPYDLKAVPRLFEKMHEAAVARMMTLPEERTRL